MNQIPRAPVLCCTSMGCGDCATCCRELGCECLRCAPATRLLTEYDDDHDWDPLEIWVID